jgi:WD40 repeat protein
MTGFRRCPTLLLMGFFVLLSQQQTSPAQQPKDKALPKIKGNGALLTPEPLAIRLGDPLSAMSMVVRPAPVKGAVSWGLETRKHRTQPSSFSVSPDGVLAATGGWDGTIHIWDIATGKLLRVLVGHNSSVYGVAFSPDGSVIASTGSFDETARVWNPRTGMVLRVLKKHKGFTSGVAWSPDGATLAVSGGNSGFVTFWDPVQNRQLRTVEHGNKVNGMAWSPDGKALACATDQGAFLWNPADGSSLGTIRVEANRVPSLCWSPDCKFMLVGAMRTTDVWEMEANKSKKLVTNLDGTGWVVSWSPDGQTVATCYGDGMLLFNTKTFARERQVIVPARAFDWNRKLGTLYAMTTQNVTVLDVADEQKKRSFDVADSETFQWTTGRPMVSGLNDKSLKLWDAAAGKLLANLNAHTDSVLSAAWSKDGKLATGSKDMTARVWDGKTGKLLQVFGGHTQEVKAVAWSPDGKLATACADKIVRVFVAGQEKPIELHGHAQAVNAVVWRDSKTLVSGSNDGKIRIWNLDTAKPAVTIEVDHDISAFAVSHDGNYLACGGPDNVARIYSFSGGKALHGVDPKTGAAEFFDLSWSPDGAALATTNYRLLLWNWRTEKQLHGYEIGGATFNIGWSTDGKTTIAGCLDRAVRFCDTPKGLLRGTMISDGKQIVSIAAEGHHKAPGDIEAGFVYVVQTEKTQDTYEPKTFVARFGWKNNPAAVKLGGN